MTQNEIYKQIEIETAQCIEQKYSFWKFKPRRHYEPECRASATAKYRNDLNIESVENERIQDLLDSKLLNGNMDIIITLIVALLIIAAVYFYLLN